MRVDQPPHYYSLDFNNQELNNSDRECVVGSAVRSKERRNRRRKRAAKESPPMECQSPPNNFSLKWKVQYCGSFPIAKVNAENITKRLDSVLPNSKHGQSGCGNILGKPVLLAVSLTGVSIFSTECALKDFEAIIQCTAPLFCHSLRKVTCVVGRAESRQIAYITKERISHSGNDVPYRKQCHIFSVNDTFEVEEIETVLNNAFQRASMQAATPLYSSIPESLSRGRCPPQIKQRKQFDTMLNTHPTHHHQWVTPYAESGCAHRCSCSTSKPPQTPSFLNTPISTKRASFLQRSRKQVSSNTIFQRFFGGSSANLVSARIPKNGECPTPVGCNVPQSIATSEVRFRRPPIHPVTPCMANIEESDQIPNGTPMEPLNGLTNTPKSSMIGCKGRKRRPVSAVFGHAMQRLSSAAASTSGAFHWVNHGKNATSKEKQVVYRNPLSENTQCPDGVPTSQTRPFSSPMINLHAAASTTPRRSAEKLKEIAAPPTLVFDEKLGEWIYPIDERLLKQLEELAYFCKNPDKELVYARLRTMPEGTFVLRLSGSRKRCLALSLRVSEEKNPDGIAHYLIVKNEHGFRIKGSKHYFPTLPMLVTHHTVISEQLPCRLIFADLGASLLKSRSAMNISTVMSSLQHGDGDLTNRTFRTNVHSASDITTTMSTLVSSSSAANNFGARAWPKPKERGRESRDCYPSKENIDPT
ncbi:SH2 domain-containing protein [Ditylenchus destructor]|nr:SH2 domain-containing protein [Ditylenchus destructor]